jgi:hypothetical protein
VRRFCHSGSAQRRSFSRAGLRLPRPAAFMNNPQSLFQLLTDLLLLKLARTSFEPVSLRLRRITAWNYCNQEKDICQRYALGSLPHREFVAGSTLNW